MDKYFNEQKLFEINTVTNKYGNEKILCIKIFKIVMRENINSVVNKNLYHLFNCFLK